MGTPGGEAQGRGIHGTLFYQLEEKKAYYPTKQAEITGSPWNAAQRRMIARSRARSQRDDT
jgi:hypothetical protein